MESDCVDATNIDNGEVFDGLVRVGTGMAIVAKMNEEAELL